MNHGYGADLGDPMRAGSAAAGRAGQRSAGGGAAVLVTLAAGAAGSAIAWLVYRALRANGRHARAAQARERLQANARSALAMKRAGGVPPRRPASFTPGEGMRPIENRTIAPSGALNSEGHRPVLERSRKVR